MSIDKFTNWAAFGDFSETGTAEKTFDESKHPRGGKGTPQGGKFAPKGTSIHKAVNGAEYEVSDELRALGGIEGNDVPHTLNYAMGYKHGKHAPGTEVSIEPAGEHDLAGGGRRVHALIKNWKPGSPGERIASSTSTTVLMNLAKREGWKFAVSKSRTKAFDPSKHPHKGQGPGGGQFAPKGTPERAPVASDPSDNYEDKVAAALDTHALENEIKELEFRLNSDPENKEYNRAYLAYTEEWEKRKKQGERKS